MQKPQIINFDKIGSSQLGYITVAETQKNIPFEIKRVYWTYFTPQDIVRGGHAQKELKDWYQFIKTTPDYQYFSDSKMMRYYNILAYRIFRYTSIIWGR